jgi:uncharacterized membrane protein YcaP (DUF421 family)
MEFKEIFIGDFDWHTAYEILVRTLIMFIVALAFLRLTGKKGIRQLSLFEVAIIISLGSAVGDPMINKDAAILPSALVVVIILLFYRFITWMMSKSPVIESILEGDPLYIIEEGVFVLSEANKHTFAKDEFLAEMRRQSIEHLGQVRIAILESNGEISFFFYPDEEVKLGMPVLPKPQKEAGKNISRKAHYACTYCGNIEDLLSPKKCSRCEHEEWIEAIQTKRCA